MTPTKLWIDPDQEPASLQWHWARTTGRAIEVLRHVRVVEISHHPDFDLGAVLEWLDRHDWPVVLHVHKTGGTG